MGKGHEAAKVIEKKKKKWSKLRRLYNKDEGFTPNRSSLSSLYFFFNIFFFLSNKWCEYFKSYPILYRTFWAIVDPLTSLEKYLNGECTFGLF